MTFPVEYYRQIKDAIVFTARKQAVARKIINTRNISGGIGVQQWTYDTANEVSDALLTYQFTDTSEDWIELARTDVPIPLLHKEYRISRRDLAAAARGGFGISTATVQSAAYKVMNLENQLILNGFAADGTTYDIKGLYQSAGNYTAGKDFATAGQPLESVATAIDLMQADNITGPYNMVLNPTQYMELATSVLGSGAGEREMAMVKEILEGGSIFSTSFQATGTGMLLADASAGFFEMVVAQDMTTETEVLQKSKDLWGRVYECAIPVIYDANAICKLTTI
ncbi:MAG: family 1 encapsulin nanocompartment shell protein [Bacilli bacterium]|jgi:uncharacterized linocin/CFP29 family protein